jgi:uncharacterized membrane protein YebE (DUF533 family)
MFDSKRILEQLVSSGFAGGMAGGAAGAAVIGALSGKKAKKYAGTALKAGGLALIGGLAYKAWQHYKDDQSGQTTNNASAFLPDSQQEADQLNLLLVRAMISAARADGRIDNDENRIIMSRIGEIQLDDSERAYLFEQFAAPVDLNILASDAKTEAQAAEIYAASVIILATPSAAERQYLDDLAAALKLPNALRQEIHHTLQAQQAAA